MISLQRAMRTLISQQITKNILQYQSRQTICFYKRTSNRGYSLMSRQMDVFNHGVPLRMNVVRMFLLTVEMQNLKLLQKTVPKCSLNFKNIAISTDLFYEKYPNISSLATNLIWGPRQLALYKACRNAHISLKTARQ